jgi:alkylated DNA repair dioxygenase AlkB
MTISQKARPGGIKPGTFSKLDTLAPRKAIALLEWEMQQNLHQEHYNEKPTCRFQKWWGIGANLYAGGMNQLYRSNPIESEHTLVKLVEKYYPEANSILLYRYAVGASIAEHSDRPCWDRKVVLINLVDASPNLFGEKPFTRFKFDGQNHLLGDGDVIEFDAGTHHGVPAVKHTRYSLQLRRIAQ